jgi:hypothetical protein
MTFPVATGRIVLNWSDTGIAHVLHCYVRNPQLVGADWMINSRTTDANDTHWYDAAHSLMVCVSNMLSATASAGTHLLQTRSGGVWTTVDTTTQAATNQNGTLAIATQLSMTLRDKLFNRFRLQIMEINGNAPGKIISPTAGGANTDALAIEFTPSFTLSTPPYDWVVSGWNQYLSTAPFVSIVIALNRKMRRARAVA